MEVDVSVYVCRAAERAFGELGRIARGGSCPIICRRADGRKASSTRAL